MSVKDLDNSELVNYIVDLDRNLKEGRRDLEKGKAEIQARGLQEMENKNTKYVRYYGDRGTASVMDSVSLDVLNVDKLKNILTESVFDSKVKITTETKYKFNANLEKMLKAVFTGDYDFSYTLEEFLDNMSVPVDAKQKKLLLKKLKGNYEKDKSTMISVLGYGTESEAPDFDVELYYIYRIKNAELIRAFLPEGDLEEVMQEIRKCLIVDTKTSITIDYEEE